MLYVVTAKNMHLLNEIKNSGSQVAIFYKDTDTIKISDLAAISERLRILDTSDDAHRPQVSYLSAPDRDTTMMLLGELFATSAPNQVCILDDAISVPARYADRVTVFNAKAAPKKRVPRKPNAKAKSKSVVSDKPADASVGDADTEGDGASQIVKPVKDELPMNPPASATGMDDPDAGKEPVFDNATCEELYKLLGVRSADVQFHWNTDMLMSQILSDFGHAKTDADARQSLSCRNYGKALLARIDSLGCFAKVRELGAVYIA